jgi:hypothetical protein
MVLNAGQPGFIDLIAFSGYKYVVMCPIAIADSIVDYFTSYIVMIVLCVDFGFFFYKTL